MLVSVITVCFNSEKTIRKTIESVLEQSYSQIEYIIVDGLSKDSTVNIAREYETQFQNKGCAYQIISEKDAGIYDAMNKGIKLAQGELIGIINSDDWFEPNAVEIAVATLQETGYDMFYADLNLIKSDNSMSVKHSKLDRFPTTRHWNHPTTFVTKKTYDELGGFKNKGGLYDDFDLMLRVRRAGKKMEIRNVVLANFRIGGASHEKSIKKCFSRFKDRYSCYRDNGYSRFYIFECLAMEFVKWLIA